MNLVAVAWTYMTELGQEGEWNESREGKGCD
jgi:hypothetical protein